LKHAIPALKKRGGGTFVASSSVASLMNQVGCETLYHMVKEMSSSLIAYSSSKSAVDEIVRCAAGAYKNDNINVFGLNYGTFDSEMVDTVMTRMGGQAGVPNGEPTPVSGFNPFFKASNGLPQGISKVVISLVDGSSKWSTGSNIVVDHDATIDAKYFYEAYFSPGPPDAFGWPSPDTLKAKLMTASSAEPFFAPPVMPSDAKQYISATGLPDALKSAVSAVIIEKPIDAKRRVAELLLQQ